MEGVSMEQSFCYNHVLQLYVKDTVLRSWEMKGRVHLCCHLPLSEQWPTSSFVKRNDGFSLLSHLVVVSTAWNHECGSVVIPFLPWEDPSLGLSRPAQPLQPGLQPSFLLFILQWTWVRVHLVRGLPTGPLPLWVCVLRKSSNWPSRLESSSQPHHKLFSYKFSLVLLMWNNLWMIMVLHHLCDLWSSITLMIFGPLSP